jgi:peptidoglycan hydrolase CwlO-like protein
MANLFGILTAIVLAVSALVAFKNKGAYEANLIETEKQEGLLVTSQKRLKSANEVLEALPVEIKGVDDEAAALAETEAALTKANDGLKAEVEPLTAKIAANKEQLDGVRSKTEKIGDLKELSSKMRATSAELEELTQSIASAEAKLANLTSQNTATESQINDGKRRAEDYSSGRSFPSLKTRIRSIYPNWGFVTLASGNNAGVVTNSTLDVVRGGETIAKLLVTAVESTTSSATIIPESMSSDVTLMVGDAVVPGQKAAVPSVPVAPATAAN